MLNSKNNDATIIFNSTATNPLNQFSDMTALGQHLNINQNNTRVYRGVLEAIRSYPVSRNPILYDMLCRTNGLIEKLISIPINKAFSKTPNIKFTKSVKNLTKYDFDNQNEILVDFKNHLTQSFSKDDQSIFTEENESKIMAQALGNSFVVLCTDREDDDLTEPLPIDDYTQLHRSKIGNIHLKTVSLAFNNKYDTAKLLNMFDFEKYKNLDQKKTKKVPELIRDLQDVDKHLLQNVENIKEDSVYLYIGNEVKKVHTSRIIVQSSTNKPTGFTRFRNNGFSYSEIEKIINPVLIIENILQSSADLVQRMCIMSIENQESDMRDIAGSANNLSYQEIDNVLNNLGNVDLKTSILHIPGMTTKLLQGSLTGVKEAMEMAQEMIAMNSYCSVLELKGEGANGFSSGEDMIEYSNDRVEYLRSFYKGKMQYIYNIIFANQYQLSRHCNDIIAIDWDSARSETKDQEIARKTFEFNVLEKLYLNGSITTEKFNQSVNDMSIFKNKIAFDDNESSEIDSEVSQFDQTQNS